MSKKATLTTINNVVENVAKDFDRKINAALSEAIEELTVLIEKADSQGLKGYGLFVAKNQLKDYQEWKYDFSPTRRPVQHKFFLVRESKKGLTGKDIYSVLTEHQLYELMSEGYLDGAEYLLLRDPKHPNQNKLSSADEDRLRAIAFELRKGVKDNLLPFNACKRLGLAAESDLSTMKKLIRACGMTEGWRDRLRPISEITP